MLALILACRKAPPPAAAEVPRPPDPARLEAVAGPVPWAWDLAGTVLTAWRPSSRPVRAAPFRHDESSGPSRATGGTARCSSTTGRTGSRCACRRPSGLEDDGHLRAYALPGFALLDELRVSPPQREGPVLLYEALRHPGGEWWVRADVDDRITWVAVGPPAP